MRETTPRPWQTLKPHQIGNWAIAATDARVTMIAEMLGDHHRHDSIEADARLIVRAVNAHDALVDALRAFPEWGCSNNDCERWDAIRRAALALAEAD